MLKIEVKTVDQEGRPIPWITVGSTFIPEKKGVDKWTSRPDLSLEDPMRILRQYSGSWEYWNYHVKPVQNIDYVGVTDKQGSLFWKLDKDDFFNGNPGKLDFSFVGQRYGFEASETRVSVPANENKVEVTLVLKKSKNFLDPVPDYLQKFYEGKVTINDRRKNEELSMENYQRLKNLHEEFLQLAVEAQQKGDSRSAGLIMYWVGLLPSINILNGQIIGYRSSPDDNEFYQTLKKALEYDPNNDQIRSQYLVFKDRWIRNNDPDFIKSLSELIKEMDALDKKSGSHLWPIFHFDIWTYYSTYGNEQQRAINKMVWLHNFEPCWEKQEEFEKTLKYLQKNMAKKSNQ